MEMACKSFWECLLKVLNFLLILVSLAMIGYGVYLFVEYKNDASTGIDSPTASPSMEFAQLGRLLLLMVSVADRIFDNLPKACYIDYLFLGDYADRGQHNMEAITLLLALTEK